jgi:hypothetical protein
VRCGNRIREEDEEEEKAMEMKKGVRAAIKRTQRERRVSKRGNEKCIMNFGNHTRDF